MTNPADDALLRQIVSSQRNEPVLEFKASDLKHLSAVPQFTLHLDVKRRNDAWPLLEGIEIKLALPQCATFYERERGLAYVEQEPQSEKGSAPFPFEFMFENCGGFHFDSKNADAFKVELFN